MRVVFQVKWNGDVVREVMCKECSEVKKGGWGPGGESSRSQGKKVTPDRQTESPDERLREGGG
jgi:hypothetical protein